MGQKVNPVGMRVGINKDWNTHWFADGSKYSEFLLEDIKIREFIDKKFGKDALISHVEIARKQITANDREQALRLYSHIFTAKPGVVVGQGGETQKKLIEGLKKVVKANDISLSAIEVKEPNLDATIVAKKIALDLENRVSFRMAQKKALREVKLAGAQGIKTSISGRLGGAEIARSEGYKEGTIALQTLRSDIDYAEVDAATQYGRLGVKVWICRGEKVIKEKKALAKEGE